MVCQIRHHFIVERDITDKMCRQLLTRGRGAEHDSTAFKNSSLYTWLVNNWNTLKEKGYYLIGDSVYSIRSFLTLHMIMLFMEQQRIITTSSIHPQESPSSVHSEKWI
ncbi:hypothetical protein ACHAXH_000771 [Discostella pseudostelligera]